MWHSHTPFRTHIHAFAFSERDRGTRFSTLKIFSEWVRSLPPNYIEFAEMFEILDCSQQEVDVASKFKV
jgi:hypothetical protein